MRMIAQDEEDCEKLREMGFTCTQIFENDLMVIGNIRIHRTECIHGDNPDLIERMGKASGFVLEAPDEKPLYIAGDTVYYDGVKETIERYRPEVIILNTCATTTPRGRLIMNADAHGLAQVMIPSDGETIRL